MTNKENADPQDKSDLSSVIPELEQLWLKHSQSYCDRLENLQQMVKALRLGNLTPEQQQEGKREAHTMKGSLGCFGFQKASFLARQIEEIFKQEELLQPSQDQLIFIEELEQLVNNLQQELETLKNCYQTDQFT